jgi:hypothetical protein
VEGGGEGRSRRRSKRTNESPGSEVGPKKSPIVYLVRCFSEEENAELDGSRPPLAWGSVVPLAAASWTAETSSAGSGA